MDKTVSVQVLRRSLNELLSDVADRCDRVLITREGKPAAVLLPIGEYDALEETVQILSDADAVVAIDAGLAELQRDETLTLNERSSHGARGAPIEGPNAVVRTAIPRGMALIPHEELRNNIREVLSRAEAGERLTITICGRPVAEFGPARTRQWVDTAELRDLWDLPADPRLKRHLEGFQADLRALRE